MRLLLLVAMTSVIGATSACAYPQLEFHRKKAVIAPPDTLSADSLQSLYNRIDMLSVRDLNKWRESYIYKNRTQPCSQNKQILLYIEDRLKLQK